MTTRTRRASSLPWEHWQSSAIACAALSPEQRAMGYTVVRVPPACRPAFLDLVKLMTLYGRLCGQRSMPGACWVAWATWALWTRRLAGAFARIVAGEAATIPPVPEVHEL